MDRRPVEEVKEESWLSWRKASASLICKFFATAATAAAGGQPQDVIAVVTGVLGSTFLLWSWSHLWVAQILVSLAGGAAGVKPGGH